MFYVQNFIHLCYLYISLAYDGTYGRPLSLTKFDIWAHREMFLSEDSFVLKLLSYDNVDMCKSICFELQYLKFMYHYLSLKNSKINLTIYKKTK